MKKNREITLLVATLVTGVAGTGWLRLAAGGQPAPVVAQTGTSKAQRTDDGAPARPAWLEHGARRDDYSAIGHSDLFGNPPKPPAIPDLPPLSVDNANVRVAEVVNQQRAPLPTPQSEGIAVIGRVIIDDVDQAVVEDTKRGETRWVAVGGEAFGYRVSELTLDGATLERDDRKFVLAFGENKPEVKPRALTATISVRSSAQPITLPLVAGANDPNSPRSWDWRNMTDEQREAARDYMRQAWDNGDIGRDRGERGDRGREPGGDGLRNRFGDANRGGAGTLTGDSNRLSTFFGGQ